MTTVNMHQAKSQLSKLVKRASKGEEIVIACNGTPAARLVALEPKRRKARPLGGEYAGKIWMSDDFNDPMPDEFTGIAD